MNRVVSRIVIPVFDSQRRRLRRAVSLGHLVTGPDLDELEQLLKRRTGRRHAILVSNGFSALFAAVKFAYSGEGGAVTIPVSTCFAVQNAMRANALRIRFVDADPSSMGTPELSPLAGDAIIVAPDHFGNPSPIVSAGRPVSIPVIHDAAQSFFSLEPSHSIVPLMTTLSFYPSKLANGIDGGAILLDSDDLAARIRRFCSYEDQVEPETEFRMNMRMPNLHAAFLLGTLEHMSEIREKMREGFARLRAAAQRAGFHTAPLSANAVPTRFLTTATSGIDRDALIERMRGGGVQACRELVWLGDPANAQHYPVARALVQTTCSIPLHPCLSEHDIEHMERLFV